MKKSYFLSMTFNNVIFKGRNQAYGAYVLRRSYSKNIMLAAILATALFSGALVGPLVEAVFFADPAKYEKPEYVVYEPVLIKLPKPPKKEEPQKEVVPVTEVVAQEKSKTEKFTKPTVVEENTPLEAPDIPDQALLSKVNIGEQTLDGELPETPTTTTRKVSPATGGEIGLETKPEVFIHAEVMPAFEGGTEALFEYLSKKLRYPSEAQRAKVEGMVVVTFVVAPSGEITQAEVIKGLGFGTEEEALRVIEKMPRWKPGKQNGRNVPVRYTLPIRFHLK
ncbi:protein TonB [Pontibacter ummariensis]|uniref:Protein TonB n=1 Tax=Pontibacter ummariensis TaxID=1610492 RepID=A0A239JH07_9BACT|nr:energy transducer TonB [Pontibacter ummariensis]PRY07814.1 protein TonB [Pontibacter ummariensis]SNT05191.1 protein TonB [Pontibacter ummariensis]